MKQCNVSLHTRVLPPEGVQKILAAASHGHVSFKQFRATLDVTGVTRIDVTYWMGNTAKDIELGDAVGFVIDRIQASWSKGFTQSFADCVERIEVSW